MTRVLTSASELRARMDAGERPVLLDVRWVLGRDDGRDAYLAGHLPGAVFVDLQTDLSAPPSTAAGRHPLPDADHLQTAARRWGISAGDAVVAYDDNGGLAAAHTWWLLRWAGLIDVTLLDGGLRAWVDAGGALVDGDVAPAAGDVVLRGGQLPTLDADEAATLARTGTLLDARAGERYRGETEPIDPREPVMSPVRATAPTTDNLTADGRFRSPDELRARFAGLVGDGPVAAYCGSGVTAAHELAALELAGIAGALYPGSWSQWSNDAERPVATGPEPG